MGSPNSWNEIYEWISKSHLLLIKKLARNDSSWADDPTKHQYGLYIPQEIRQSDFFPKLQNLNVTKPHIYQTAFKTLWPFTGEIKESNLRHFSNKGSEMHFTGVPKCEFSGLTPASLLIGGVLREAIDDIHHWFMVIDSGSEEAELIESAFDLSSDFHYGLFDPKIAFSAPRDETEQLIYEINTAIKSGTLMKYLEIASKIPTPSVLAAEAQRIFLQQSGYGRLDPYEISNPGDAVMKISRDIEYELYKHYERRHRAVDIVRILSQGGMDVATSVVRGYSELNATFLSASQSRKSRAGRSFENHMSRLLSDGQIRFQEQIVTGGRRPDFVLPNVTAFKSKVRTYDEALILSLKTTLRERWKQVTMEKFNCALFLATVDDRVSSDAIQDMHSIGIHLVVPESLKKSKDTCYSDKTNVITFRDFFDEEISVKRSAFRVKI